MAAREGGFMKKWFGAAAVLLAAHPAFAADVATCTHLERFQAKWIPVRVKKTRQNKK
jgi:hypothetical protein